MTDEQLLGMEALGLDTLAPGVVGYAVQTEEALYVPVVIALMPGGGDVGRYLDSLPANITVRFPTVLSPILAGMLKRRGFTLTREWDDLLGEWASVWERRAMIAGQAP